MSRINIGQKGSFHKTISEYDIYGFAGISGDFNRFHVDEVYAQSTFFKNRIAHGVLLLSFVSTVLGTQVPGPGTILSSMSAEFLKPAYIGNTIETSVEIISIDGNRVELSFRCLNENNEVLVKGIAKVSVSKEML